MKIACIAATILAASATFVSAAPGQWTAQHCSPDNGCGRQTPSIDELNAIYGTFCDICDAIDQVNAILDLDAQFCGICEVIDEIPDPSTCFSEISTVQVQNLGSVTMRDLKVGDHVLTQSGNYEPVYAFGHKNPTASAQFIQFKTAETSLEMTGSHLVFLEGKTNPVRADSIKVGDVFQGNNAQVKKIKNIERNGLYTPLTPSGTVVVDGIVASSYISLQKDAAEFVEFQGGVTSIFSFQDMIHMALSPFRMFCMGVSSRLGNTYTEEGIPLYAAYGMDLAKWADSQNIVIQFVMFLAAFAVAGASMIVENTFGPSMAPFAMAAGAGAYALMNKNGISFRTNKIKSV